MCAAKKRCSQAMPSPVLFRRRCWLDPHCRPSAPPCCWPAKLRSLEQSTQSVCCTTQKKAPQAKKEMSRANSVRCTYAWYDCVSSASSCVGVLFACVSSSWARGALTSLTGDKVITTVSGTDIGTVLGLANEMMAAKKAKKSKKKKKSLSNFVSRQTHWTMVLGRVEHLEWSLEWCWDWWIEQQLQWMLSNKLKK